MNDSNGFSKLLEGFSEPRPFTLATVGDAPRGSGVHVVGGPEPDDGIVYVGHTGALRDRLRNHLNGGRQSSVLHDQVGQLLDGDEPGSASRDAIREWLATCRISWIEVEDHQGLKGRLVEALRPRFNRLGSRGPEGKRSWWINQGRSFNDEEAGWVVFAGTDRPDGRVIAHHHALAEVTVGDVTVHYASGVVRAIGAVHAAAVRCGRPYGPRASRDVGLAVRVEYFVLDEPLTFAELPGERPAAGPFDRNGAVRQGYCFKLSDTWAETLRTQYQPRWPAGSPWWQGERRYWIFQAQPDQWDLAAHLPTMPPGTTDMWTASKHRTGMQSGDGVVLWSGGASAGIYGLARLNGEPELRGRPEFRPESVGDEEWRVPLVVTAHVRPPILKPRVQADPRLSNLSVLKTPWAGTNQPLTADEWRAVVASLPMEGPMEDGWDAFVHWARRLRETIDFDANERLYKLSLAEMFNEARATSAEGEPWHEPLRKALTHKDNNLLGWRITQPFLKWLETDSDEAEPAMRIIWDAALPHADAVQQFAAAMPRSVAAGAGTRAGLATVLRLPVDPTGSPVVRPATFTRVRLDRRCSNDTSDGAVSVRGWRRVLRPVHRRGRIAGLVNCGPPRRARACLGDRQLRPTGSLEAGRTGGF